MVIGIRFSIVRVDHPGFLVDEYCTVVPGETIGFLVVPEFPCQAIPPPVVVFFLEGGDAVPAVSPGDGREVLVVTRWDGGGAAAGFVGFGLFLLVQ